MALTKAEIEALDIHLREKIGGYVSDFLGAWDAAASKAVHHAALARQKEESWVYWAISLAGNMLWAATVFFPPAAAIGTVSRATKICSVLGAAGGAGIVAKVMDSDTEPTQETIEKLFNDEIALRRGALEKCLVEFRHEWASGLRSYLISRAVARSSTSASDITYADVTTIDDYDSRKFVWESYVFPAIAYDGSQYAVLLATMNKEMGSAVASFVAQYEAWRKRVWRCLSTPSLRNDVSPYWLWTRCWLANPFTFSLKMNAPAESSVAIMHFELLKQDVGRLVSRWKGEAEARKAQAGIGRAAGRTHHIERR